MNCARTSIKTLIFRLLLLLLVGKLFNIHFSVTMFLFAFDCLSSREIYTRIIFTENALIILDGCLLRVRSVSVYVCVCSTRLWIFFVFFYFVQFFLPLSSIFSVEHNFFTSSKCSLFILRKCNWWVSFRNHFANCFRHAFALRLMDFIWFFCFVLWITVLVCEICFSIVADV